MKQVSVAQMMLEQGHLKMKNAIERIQKVASEKHKLLKRQSNADSSTGNPDQKKKKH